MKRLEEVFELHRSRSDVFSKYIPGEVAYVGSGLSDNGVVGWVKPKSGDKVFRFRGIAVSAFCEATVQVPPFIGYGCAGTSVMALEAREAMSANQLAYAAAYINCSMRWRFSWYWRAIVSRLKRLLLPATIPGDIPFNVRELMPPMSPPERHGKNRALNLTRVALGTIFDLKAGDYHSIGELPRGSVPIVSCGDGNNGVCGYFDVKHVYTHKMTIAFNGMNTLTAKYHPYPFAAKDDVAVCFPKQPLRLTTQLFIQVMLSREQWRFSYYRKCYKEKLTKLTIPMPTRNGKIDEQIIEELMRSTPYWSFLRDRLHQTPV